MKLLNRIAIGTCAAALGLVLTANPAPAASPSAAQALKLKPIQADVDFDIPSAGEVDKCKIDAKRIGENVGWIVEDPDGLPLRRFVDTNGDNVVDQWSYFKDGLEVYRDIDFNFDGKADQYRWFQTAGSRWGLDTNQDGTIDQWKEISAEEVSAEIVAALATRDAQRFARLLLTPDELKSLGLGDAKTRELAAKIGRLAAGFQSLASRQSLVAPGTQWIQFSSATPGLVPAGTDGSSKDLRVYENAAAIVETDGKPAQLQIGTLLQVGNGWRAIDLPQAIEDGQADAAASGFFFQTALASRNEASAGGANGDAQKLLADLEKLDQAVAQATTPEAQARYTAQRADLLEQIAEHAAGPDRAMWIRQMADMVSAAVQTGTYPDGPKRLETLFERLQGNPADKELAGYVRFRQLTAKYGASLQAPNADFAKIQTEWLKNLKQYVADYPDSPDTAEAMLQLAISSEFSGQEDEAKQWYDQIVKGFNDSPVAQKAAGALTRLDSVGKPIQLSGKSPTGSPVDLAQYRGKVVLIQYWATWCEPAKRDMILLKDLVQKHGGDFRVIGVSLDSRLEDLNAFLAQNRLPWTQIYEEGGLDSRPANQLGILTLPTMILVDTQGKVVNRNIQAAELEDALGKLMR